MLEDVKVPIRLKLSALWAALMFCYVYGDYFGLYHPGQLQSTLRGDGPVARSAHPRTAGAKWLHHGRHAKVGPGQR